MIDEGMERRLRKIKIAERRERRSSGFGENLKAVFGPILIFSIWP